jgi:hypothetical protein
MASCGTALVDAFGHKVHPYWLLARPIIWGEGGKPLVCFMMTIVIGRLYIASRGVVWAPHTPSVAFGHTIYNNPVFLWISPCFWFSDFDF